MEQDSRLITDTDLENALAATETALPIKGASGIAAVAGCIMSARVSNRDVGQALDGAWVSLPLETLDEVREAFNRILDLKLGDATGED